MQKKGLIRKIRFISKLMTSQAGKEIITIHLLLITSRSTTNQTTKFDQLIEYKMRNLFLEKSYTKWSGETIPRRLSKNSKLSVSLNQ